MLPDLLTTPPPTFTPRQYQFDALAGVENYFKNKLGTHPIVIAPQGSGKSSMIAMLIQRIMQVDRRVICLASDKRLIEQNYKEMQGIWPDAPTGIYCAGLNRKDTQPPIIYATIQSVINNPDALGMFHYVIIDECFTGDTMISTPNGEKRIDQVRCGDIVYSQIGAEKVLATSSKPVYDYYEVELSNGKSIKCTGNHKIFTNSGWKETRKLERGEVVYSIENMRTLWESVLPLEGGRENIQGEEENSRATRTLFSETEFLLSEVCKEITTDSIRCSSEKEAKSNTERHKTQTYKTWGERAVASFASVSSSTCVRNGLGSRIFDKDIQGTQERNVSELLQSGHCESRKDDSDRDRWRESLPTKEKRTGFEEAESIESIRVVSVSHIKRESPINVFNLHISGHPSYFANGIAAHNCDLLSPEDDTQYRKYIDYLMGWYPSLRVIGYTATPYRMNQGYLWEGEGALFDGVAYSISIKRLLDEGYLCPLVPHQRKGMDTSKLLITQGEFDIASQVESLADMLPLIADDIVASFKGDNRKKLLAFTPNVETAIDMACLLSERGLLCDHLTSKRTKDEQSSIIEGFKLGSFPALVSVNMVMRGFNVPDIDCVANVRAMTSPALYEQGAGRGMRIHPSKVNTLYLDYGGNIRRHGVITNVIPPRKRDARQIKQEEELNAWENMRHCDACGRVYGPPFPETCECGEVMIVPRKPNVNEYSATADGKDPMKEQPVWHDVEWTRYDRHEKEGKTPSMVVEYNVAGHTYPFREWICIEHEGFARQKAVQWWQKNALDGTPTPSTVSDALNLVDAGNVPEATKIQVVRDGKLWRIMQRVNKLDMGADEGLLL